jgi:lipid II:glycine glycyltransferase (peptidoglycan interpeptide bridge formation enzyme)
MAKPYRFFELVTEFYRYGEDYDIFTALVNGSEVAYLLVFYFGDKVEYFTPCVDAENRGSQPLSLLIFEAMKKAISRKMRIWNFGGTWKGQEGVYQFKKSWGSQDVPYRYFIQVNNDRLTKLTRDELAGEYPYFYVIPYERQVTVC